MAAPGKPERGAGIAAMAAPSGPKREMTMRYVMRYVMRCVLGARMVS